MRRRPEESKKKEMKNKERNSCINKRESLALEKCEKWTKYEKKEERQKRKKRKKSNGSRPENRKKKAKLS